MKNHHNIKNTVLDDLCSHGVSTAWWNLRWRVGYWIGGFTSAKRNS